MYLLTWKWIFMEYFLTLTQKTKQFVSLFVWIWTSLCKRMNNNEAKFYTHYESQYEFYLLYVSHVLLRFRRSTSPLVNFLLRLTAPPFWHRPSWWASSLPSSCCWSWPTPCTWSSTWNISSMTTNTRTTSTSPKTLNNAVWKTLLRKIFCREIIRHFKKSHSWFDANNWHQTSGVMVYFQLRIRFLNIYF